MAQPPKTPPHSDIEGVNRDARIGTPRKDDHPSPGSELQHAGDENKGRPERTPPEGDAHLD